MKITIASGKGGTGKTLVSVNLAYMWHEKNNETETVLVDLDVEEPNDHVFFDAKCVSSQEVFRLVPVLTRELCTLCKRCHDVCRFNAVTMFPDTVLILPELCHSCNACVDLCPENALKMQPYNNGEIRNYGSRNMQLWDGLLKIGEASAVPLIAELKKQVSSVVLKNADCFFDAPPGTSCPMIESIRDADFVIIVAENTPFGIHDMELAIETVIAAGLPLGVIINKLVDDAPDLINVCNKYQVPILTTIPHNIEIAKFLANGGLAFRTFDLVRKSLQPVINHLEKIKNL
jgi:MinD superfamily P-loop ATPase